MVGDLNQRIRIEQQGTTTDPTYGPQLGAWSTLDTVWARVEEILEGDSEKGGTVRLAERKATVRVRYRTDITTLNRIVLLDRGNRIMRIVSEPVEIGGRKRFVEFSVKEFTAFGSAA